MRILGKSDYGWLNALALVSPAFRRCSGHLSTGYASPLNFECRADARTSVSRTLEFKIGETGLKVIARDIFQLFEPSLHSVSSRGGKLLRYN